ncbi:DUF2124 family protein [Chloroflexota bacterium]
MKKKVLSIGKGYTQISPIFRELISKTGIKAQENLIFAGCSGACYSIATLLSFGIRDLNLNMYYAVESDIHQLWRLEYKENVGVIATRKVNPLKVKVIVLMSGLCRIPLEHTLKFIDDALVSGGTIIGETAASGMFEEHGWDEQVPFNFLFEFSTEKPTSFEVVH